MEQAKKITSGYFFLTLSMVVTLVVSTTSLLLFLFQAFERAFPDVLNSTYMFGYNAYQYDGMRNAMATLIIFFPLFLVLAHFWIRHSPAEGTGNRTLKKWALYVVMFFTALLLAIDLVTLVRYFTSGEITVRFILKVLSVLVVGKMIAVFTYGELSDTFRKRFLTRVLTMIVSIVISLGAIIYSFSIMGSPGTQRAYRLDDRRVEDLQSIQYQVINYWQQKEKLPQVLKDLSNPLTNYTLPVDPEFEKGKTYEYEIRGTMTFALCATFSLPIPKGWVQNGSSGGVIPMKTGGDVAVSTPTYPGGINESWDHQAGRTCFERIIDKDLYPPYPKN